MNVSVYSDSFVTVKLHLRCAAKQHDSEQSQRRGVSYGKASIDCSSMMVQTGRGVLPACPPCSLNDLTECYARTARPDL